MYRHGAYADLQPTQDFVPPKGVGTLPVYFGVLPVHQLMDYSGAVNKPVLLLGYSDALSKVGYNDSNWGDFDLCEAIYAHYKNSIQVIGPIVVVNVLDPDTMKTPGQTADVTLIGGQGLISNDKIILKSVAIVGKVLGTDFTAQYTADGTKVQIRDLTGALVSPVTVTFDIIDLTAVTAEEVNEGMAALELVYPTHKLIPTILDAPGWSHDPDVDAELKARAQGINGHWYAFVNSNLSVGETSNIPDEAETWKAAEGYTGAGEAPCWPMAKKGTRVFHLSTLTTVTMQRVDYSNGNVPFETPSNKPIDITALCLDDGTDIVFDQTVANALNQSGIRTAIYWGGRWVLWGPHTGAYAYGADMDARDKFDSSVRMMYHIANTFQVRYGTEVDKPFNRGRVDTILNDFQEWLDGLISRGALLGGTVVFNETSNPVSDIAEGDFVFDIATTTTPPGKSLTAKVQYTAAGLTALLGGEQA